MRAAAFRTALLFSPHSSFRPTVRNLRLPHFSSHIRRFSDASIPPPTMESTSPSDIYVTAGARGIGAGAVTSSMESHFGEFIVEMEKSGNIRERIRSLASEIEATNRVMHAGLLLAHQPLPIPEVLKKAESQRGVLRDLYGRLAEILHECPGQYYRFHGDWRSETQTAVSLLSFSHWLETGSLLTHAEAENKLGLDTSEFGLDIEDYLIGLCFMSNELPRYVVNQVTNGDYDCPKNVLKFLTELHSAFRMLNLRNDFLRKKFDGMKYDLRRVEEVYYDVKIRGLAPVESAQDHITLDGG
ncbi:hypothetical protein KSP39_PZI009867 [Platanthera zijinensis]|uniref:Translin n=1 Tax=Platanthera zijinensis TaxID=2320716 RepID=A0AAP0BKR6_9ASPA